MLTCHMPWWLRWLQLEATYRACVKHIKNITVLCMRIDALNNDSAVQGVIMNGFRLLNGECWITTSSQKSSAIDIIGLNGCQKLTVDVLWSSDKGTRTVG